VSRRDEHVVPAPVRHDETEAVAVAVENPGRHPGARRDDAARAPFDDAALLQQFTDQPTHRGTLVLRDLHLM
jgi:hypothetical protein